jgi:hypothetical protein
MKDIELESFPFQTDSDANLDTERPLASPTNELTICEDIVPSQIQIIANKIKLTKQTPSELAKPPIKKCTFGFYLKYVIW